MKRCDWGNTDNQLYQEYHDHEWGKLNLDNQYLYEMLLLESFQSGLSWETILNKRDNFRKAFADFNYHQVANFDQTNFEELMQNSGIVRNKMKINAAINNAKVILELEKFGSSFADFLRGYIPKPIINHPKKMSDVSAETTLSDEISKEMKKMGFKFVGPTTVYSFMQAVGLVNDHLDDCDFK